MSYHDGLTADPRGTAALSPGLAFLRDCVSGQTPAALAGGLAALREAGESVSAIVNRHGLAPLAYRRLSEADLKRLPAADDWSRLAESRELALSRQALLVSAGMETAAALKTAGVRWVVPVKGLALAALLWPECLDRTMDDVDLLVPEDQLPHAEGVIGDLGFVCEAMPQAASAHHHAPLRRRGAVLVELHWSLWAPSALPLPHPTAEGIAERSTATRLGGGTLSVPGPEDAFILSAGALARESFDAPLRAWADLHWLLADPRLHLRHEALQALARELGLGDFVELMVRLVVWLFAGPSMELPGAGEAVLRAEARLRPIVARRLHEGTHRADRHAWLLQQAQRDRRRSRGRRAPGRTLLKAARYAAGLTLSGRQRRELGEELAIRRSLASLRK